MANQVTGLDGYYFYELIDPVAETYNQLNHTVVADAAPFTVPNLTSDTDFAGTYFVAPVDKAGNVGAKVLLTDTKTLSSTPDQEPMDSDRVAAIDAIVARCIAAGAGPGVAVAITSPFGHMEKNYGSTTTGVDDHFRLASQTKGFTRHALLMALDAGLIGSLDDTLETYLPGYPSGDIMTLKQMMMMRAGVFDYSLSMTGGPLGLGLLNLATNFTLNPTMAFSVDQILNIIKTNPTMFVPGTAYYYTNANYYLLAKVVEAVDPSHRSIDQIIIQDICGPLGMVNTTFPLGVSGVPAPAAVHYDYNPILQILGIVQLRDITVQNTAFIWAAGAMCSVLSDLMIWAKAERDGTLLSPETHEMLMTTFSDVPQNPPMGLAHTGPPTFGYGLGFIQVGSWFGLDGSWLGADSCTMFEPHSGTIISVYENFQTSSPNVLAALSTVWFEIADYLYPNSVRYPGYMTGEDATGQAASAMQKMGSAGSGIVYLPGEFQPLTEVYTTGALAAVTDKNVPDGATGCYVSAIASGGHGGTGSAGAYNVTGGAGGGGGGRVNRTRMLLADMGDTFSVSFGVGLDSSFVSGALSLIARVGGNGSPANGTYNATAPGGLGGSWAASPTAIQGVAVTGVNGSPGAASTMFGSGPGTANTDDAGPGGAGGRGSYGGLSGAQAGGAASLTVPAVAAGHAGGDAADPLATIPPSIHAGSGAGEGAAGGKFGGGGAGGYSSVSSGAAAGGPGGVGVVLVEWF